MFFVKSLPRIQLLLNANRELSKAFLALIFWASLFYAIAYNPWFIEAVVNRIAFGLASVIGIVLQSLGNEIDPVGTIIQSKGFGIDIYYKCTGVYQAAGFLAGVFAYPTSLRKKASGIVWGVCCITAINIIRIVSIFYTGLHTPEWIPLFHGVFWEALMVLLTIGIWLVWAKRIQVEVLCTTKSSLSER